MNKLATVVHKTSKGHEVWGKTSTGCMFVDKDGVVTYSNYKEGSEEFKQFYEAYVKAAKNG